MGADFVPWKATLCLYYGYRDVQCYKARWNHREQDASFGPGKAVFYLDPTVRSGLCNKMRWNPCYRVVEPISSVSFRIRYQTTGLCQVSLCKSLLAFLIVIQTLIVTLLLGAFRQMFKVDSFLNGLSSVTSAEPSGFKWSITLRCWCSWWRFVSIWQRYWYVKLGCTKVLFSGWKRFLYSFRFTHS